MKSAPTPTQRARDVRCLVLDVDGVMTDGRLYLGPGGVEWKALHVRDGLGIKLLLRSGVDVAVISGRPPAGIAGRLMELGIRHTWFEADDKLRVYGELKGRLGLRDPEVAAMGDDLPDLQLLETVGLALTVADAHPKILAAAHWASRSPGGCGAVREAAELILVARGAA